MIEEFYTRPILQVRDVEASIAYYGTRLGFQTAWKSPEDEPVIAQVNRNGLEIILNSKSVIPRPAIPSILSMTLHLPDKLGAFYREFERNGAKIVTPPFEVMWEKNLFQLDVQDLDGNVLIFWGGNPEGGPEP